jgi:hypothetical protein
MNIVEAFNKLKEKPNVFIKNDYMKIGYDHNKNVYLMIHDQFENIYYKAGEDYEIELNDFVFCLEDVLKDDWEEVK